MNPNIRIQSVTLAANGQTTLNLQGSNIMFTAATAGFQFSLDGGVFQTGFAILGIDVSRDDALPGSVIKPAVVPKQFKTIILKDTSGVANTITLIVSDFPVTFTNPVPTVTTKASPTVNFGRAVASIAASATLVFAGTSNGSTLRKQIMIANIDGGGASIALHARDNAGNTIGVVFAGTSWTVETSDIVKLFNPGGASVSYNVGEIYYAT